MTLPSLTWREAPDTELQEADDPRRDIRIGAVIGFLFFVVLLGWAALAPLDAGVYAQGSIAVSGNRQSVQHRQGGTVGAIRVREGQKVRAGETLIEMAAPDLRATERALTSEYFSLVAQRERLLAERIGRSDEGGEAARRDDRDHRPSAIGARGRGSSARARGGATDDVRPGEGSGRAAIGTAA